MLLPASPHSKPPNAKRSPRASSESSVPPRPRCAPRPNPGGGFAARWGQVVVVPLRANVNLKAATVEDLVERRKVCYFTLVDTI